jgi:hypothetical protein
MLRLRKEGYKVIKSKFPNKKKRTCFNCGSTEHFVANCPHKKHDNNKRDKKESKYENHPQVKMKVMVPVTRRSRTLLSL